MSLSGNLSEKFLYKIINLIQQDSDFKAILMAIAEQTRDFLAVDRVKIYQFAEDGSGQVIAESIFNHRLPSLLGLHFPASDIPSQTREEWLAKRQSVMIDVSDQRKSFHQSYGSQVSPSINPADLAGDNCLQAIADVLCCVIKRPADIIARYGGEEFALILPDTDSLGAFHLAEMICTELRKLEIPHHQSPQGIVTLSLGLATLIPRAELNSDFLISSAEQALHQAKDEGRDRVCVFPISNT